MRNLFIAFIYFVITSNLIIAKVPESINYQAIARDNSGNPLVNQNISFKISILRETITGNTVYSETHQTQTNQFGLVNLSIGTGNVLSGDFSLIDWPSGTYFIKLEMDANAGNNFIFMGTSQLLSVPYALHSQIADSVRNSSSLKPGYGISIQNDSIINTKPATDLNITPGDGINVAGNYPDYTVSLKSPLKPPDPTKPVPMFFNGKILWVYPEDNSDSIPWGMMGVKTNATSELDGQANTSLIVSLNGNSFGYAALLCDSLVAFGHDDWYLPSILELDAIWKQSYLLNMTRYWIEYWSSTEDSAPTYGEDFAWSGRFNNWNSYQGFKNELRKCRCVRMD